MKKAWLLASLFVAGLAGGVIALQIDPVLEVGRLRLLASGVNQWIMSVDSSNRLEVRSAIDDKVVLLIDDLNGAHRPVSQPRLYYSTATASGAGYIAYNETDFAMCKSTGTGPGAWVTIESSRTVVTSAITADLAYGVGKRCW